MNITQEPPLQEIGGMVWCDHEEDIHPETWRCTGWANHRKLYIMLTMDEYNPT